MRTQNFTFDDKIYTVEEHSGLINVFELNSDEAICCGFRDTMNPEWNDSELAITLYKRALEVLKIGKND